MHTAHEEQQIMLSAVNEFVVCSVMLVTEPAAYAEHTTRTEHGLHQL